MTNKGKRGGIREGSGRKRIPDNKKAKSVTVKISQDNLPIFYAVQKSKKSWFINTCIEYYRRHRADICQEILRVAKQREYENQD